MGGKKRTKRYPQNGANAPMVGANVPTEPQNSEKQAQNAKNRGIFEEPARSGTLELKIHQEWKTKMVTKRSKKLALDLSPPPFCTKFRHDSHGANGFASYGPQNFELFLVRAGNNNHNEMHKD